MTTPVAETEDALAAAIRRVSPHTEESVIRTYRDAGWTADPWNAVAVLAEWAVEHGTGSGLITAADRTWRGLFEVRLDYERLWEFLVREREMPGDLAVGWVAALAATPDDLAWEDLMAMLRAEHPRWQALSRAWREVGPLGPRAYVAGLSMPETQDRLAAGSLEVEELSVLAALRGWQFPGIWP